MHFINKLHSVWSRAWWETSIILWPAASAVPNWNRKKTNYDVMDAWRLSAFVSLPIFYSYSAGIQIFEFINQTGTHQHTYLLYTHRDNVDVIIIREGFQHLTDRSANELQRQARHTSTPTEKRSIVRTCLLLYNYYTHYKILDFTFSVILFDCWN